MRNEVLTLPALAIALSFVATFSFAEGEKSSAANEPKSPVVFVPPASGVPADRVGAGTRDIDVSGERIRLLLPKGGGLSSKKRPRILWELMEPFEGIVQVELTALEGGERIAGAAQKRRFSPGIYGLDMERGDADLESERIYSINIYLANGKTREVIERAVGLISRRGSGFENASQAASAGIWFDALDFVTEVDFYGQVKVIDSDGFEQLLTSAGL